MSEEQEKYLTDALEMINTHPTVEIEPPRSVVSRRGRENVEEDRPAFIKFSTGFKKELANIDAVSLKVWIFIALSINRNTGKANPGLRTIAAGVGMGVNTVQAALIRLDKKYNLLSIDRESRKYNIYEPLAFVSANKNDPSVSATDTTVSEEEQTVSEKQESVSHTRILNQSNQRTREPDSAVSSKEKTKLRGIEAAIAMGRPVTNDDLFPENNPAAAVMEGLSVLNRNWPKHGENKEWDRITRLISIEVENENGTVGEFVKWVGRQKDRIQRIQWYGRKPENVWEDWPLAFEADPEEHHYPTVQELEAKGML
jgi:hypothetical protein